MKFLELDGFKDLVSSPKKIVITTHAHPDGDAIGSSLGLYHILVQLKHDVKIILPTPLPHYLSFLPESDKGTIVFEKDSAACKELIQNADLLIYLDFNHPSRVGNSMHQFLQKLEGKPIICIDHHLEFNQELYTYYYSDSDKSSTCEMIYDFISLMDWQDKITLDVMTCLYTGMVTDTGSFRFSSTSSNVHKIVSTFIESGLTPHTIHEKLFNQSSEKRLRLLGFLLSEKMKIHPNGAYGTIYLDLNTAERFHLEPGDTEGFVNYVLGIQGIQAAVFATQRFDGIKLSMRSEGDIDANVFMRRHFNGGGHKNAAGGFITKNWHEIEKIIAENLPIFIKSFN